MTRDSTRRKIFARLEDLFKQGEYEEVEATARALVEGARTGWRKRPVAEWQARTLATMAALAHGRQAEVLGELETLIAELAPVDAEAQVLRLVARRNRAVVLHGQDRHAEAEKEALDVLGDIARLAHLVPLTGIELSALDVLAGALCGQGRFEEAEAIARGNLPRATDAATTGLRATLVRSLSGQGRHEEALAESRDFAPSPARKDSGRPDLVTAEALLGLGRREEAEDAARRALSECERRLHPAHPRFGEARALLARVTGEEPGP